MEYLSGEDILEIHSILIDEIGGAHGVQDLEAVSSAADQPRQGFGGKELYPTVFEKAAVYARTIIFSHPFVDGNKRTAMTAAGIFLEMNGYRLVAAEGNVASFAFSIIEQKYELSDIASWFEQNSERIQK